MRSLIISDTKCPVSNDFSMQLVVTLPDFKLGHQAEMGSPQTLYGRSQKYLQRSKPPGSNKAIQGLERALADGRIEGGEVHGQEPISLFPLLLLPQRAMEEGPHHQHIGKRLSGGEKTY